MRLHLAVARHRRVGGSLGDAAHDGAIAVRMVRQPVGDDHVAVPVTHRDFGRSYTTKRLPCSESAPQNEGNGIVATGALTQS